MRANSWCGISIDTLPICGPIAATACWVEETQVILALELHVEGPCLRDRLARDDVGTYVLAQRSRSGFIATGLKYPLPAVTRTLDRHKPIDYAAL
jgi:hypothetical protein